MKKKEGILIIVFLVIVTLLVGGFLLYRHLKKKEQVLGLQDYTPQEEISQEQLRQTIVTVYFQNKETNKLMPEARQIDVSLLVKNPYEYLISQLLENPKSEKLARIIPEGTKLNKAELRKDILYVDFSKEFIENCPEGKENEEMIIKSIVSTLTELNEVNGVKILIDGMEDQQFKDKQINFKDVFC